MIGRLTGTLTSLEELTALVTSGPIAYEVSVPAFLVPRLESLIGKPVTFVTYHYLEGQGQGASFVPRLIGFLKTQERAFFELFTTVKGIGNRKALRAMAIDPAEIARAIARKEPATLTKLPEIGKRLAETIIAELTGKVEVYLTTGEVQSLDAHAAGVVSTGSPHTEEAMLALMALGETRGDAEKLVGRATEKARREKITVQSVEDLIGIVFSVKAI
jgi:Holliday junction DNA helicase RuvA